MGYNLMPGQRWEGDAFADALADSVDYQLSDKVRGLGVRFALHAVREIEGCALVDPRLPLNNKYKLTYCPRAARDDAKPAGTLVGTGTTVEHAAKTLHVNQYTLVPAKMRAEVAGMRPTYPLEDYGMIEGPGEAVGFTRNAGPGPAGTSEGATSGPARAGIDDSVIPPRGAQPLRPDADGPYAPLLVGTKTDSRGATYFVVASSTQLSRETTTRPPTWEGKQWMKLAAQRKKEEIAIYNADPNHLGPEEKTDYKPFATGGSASSCSTPVRPAPWSNLYPLGAITLLGLPSLFDEAQVGACFGITAVATATSAYISTAPGSTGACPLHANYELYRGGRAEQ
jgi:hypothetical protein